MSKRFLKSAVVAGASARDWRAGQDQHFAALLNESPEQLVAYAARLCAHAAERTERGDLTRLAVLLNEATQPSTLNPQLRTAPHPEADLAGADTAEPASLKLPAPPAPGAPTLS